MRKGTLGISFYSDELLALRNNLFDLNYELKCFDYKDMIPHCQLYLIEDDSSQRESINLISKKHPTIIITKSSDDSPYKQFLEGQILDILFYPMPIHLLKYKCERFLSRLSGQFRLCSREDMDLINMGLTFKQIQILRAIESSGSNGMSREELTSLIWNNQKVIPKALDVHLSGLRKKLVGSGQSIVFTDNRRWILSSQNC